jgi:hypothetical protein
MYPHGDGMPMEGLRTEATPPRSGENRAQENALGAGRLSAKYTTFEATKIMSGRTARGVTQGKEPGRMPLFETRVYDPGAPPVVERMMYGRLADG